MTSILSRTTHKLTLVAQWRPPPRHVVSRIGSTIDFNDRRRSNRWCKCQMTTLLFPSLHFFKQTSPFFYNRFTLRSHTLIFSAAHHHQIPDTRSRSSGNQSNCRVARSSRMDSSELSPEFKSSLYPEIQPYASGFLKVSNIHTLYWEQSGNPEGYVSSDQ